MTKLFQAVLAGIVGAVMGGVLGLAVSYVLVPLLRIPAMEGQAGMFALFLCVPIGAAAGFIVAAVWFLRARGVRGFGPLASHLAIVAGGTAAVVWGCYWYLFVKAVPLNPDGPAPQLSFEIRLPAGATVPPSPEQIHIYLDSSGHRSNARLFPNQFRRDGERPVIIGAVDMPYRSDLRLLHLDRPGEIGRIFHILLSSIPDHSAEFGPWERVRYLDMAVESGPAFSRPDDTHEIRYRAIWPRRGIVLD
jgi:hypothetical protein